MDGGGKEDGGRVVSGWWRLQGARRVVGGWWKMDGGRVE